MDGIWPIAVNWRLAPPLIALVLHSHNQPDAETREAATRAGAN
jgi:hypothetical protein